MDALTHAATAAAERNEAVDAEDKKRWGQFFTGTEVADFMGSLFEVPKAPTGEIRVLDPGAGVGILGIAAARHLLRQGAARVHLVAVEAEAGARAALGLSLQNAASESDGRLTFEVLDADFLDMAQPMIGVRTLDPFHCAIGNPPYFKLSPRDTRGGDAPNIYARFMEIAARLLLPDGQFVFIVPRSFASGLYFKRFRKALHTAMSLERVHIFDSRRDAFKDQGVLQENIIVRYCKGGPKPSRVVVSASCGAHDLADLRAQRVPRDVLLHTDDPHGVLHLPATAADVELLRICNAWPMTLQDYGLAISTGPVVPFRATSEMIKVPNGDDVVPLLWMHHVRADGVRWPIGDGFRKPEYIRADAPGKLLVPNQTYILMRRFSAKEEERRLTAAVFHGGSVPGERVGLENHLNFIYRPGGTLDHDEAVGLAALLNSRILDQYFRVVNGNTQVNATEIRALPLPERGLTVEIGRRLAREPARAVDDVVEEVLSVEGGRGEADLGRARDASPPAERERGVHLARDGGDQASYVLG